MGFIFKVHQPLLSHSVDLNRNHNTAGIDLIRDLHILQLPLFFQLFHGYQSKIHKADILIVPSFIDLLSVSQILLVGILNGLFVLALCKGHIFKFGGKGSMTAMVRPVGIKYTDFRHRGIPAFFLCIIRLNMKEILKGHGQIQGIIKIF